MGRKGLLLLEMSFRGILYISEPVVSYFFLSKDFGSVLLSLFFFFLNLLSVLVLELTVCVLLPPQRRNWLKCKLKDNTTDCGEFPGLTLDYPA